MTIDNKVMREAEKFILERYDWSLIAEDMPYLLFAGKNKYGADTLHYVRVQYALRGEMPVERMNRLEFERCMMRNFNAIPSSLLSADVAFHNISFAINEARDGAMIRWHENHEFSG